MDHFFFVISVYFLLCFRVRLFIDALWSPFGRGLTLLPSLVTSNCEVVLFDLILYVTSTIFQLNRDWV